ncbi:MAG: hypothetical protein CMO61_09170 [Verrucomicrobiales bacterium]|mgnify:CR=1 FL=1|nr:hypothetical protein [Verrucomicrobiales bacterium]|tara:strand:+ start:8108 stop:8467 length:360 start_codon:yes stop_codon:yes gene_type:complete
MSEAHSESLELIRESVVNPEIFEKFAIFLGGAELVDFDRLFENVDHTDYSLGDWIEAMVAFDVWLEEAGVEKRPFSEMAGYIHCCTLAAPQTVGSASLKSLVIQALMDFGFDAGADPQL